MPPDTLNFDPMLCFKGTWYKTQSQTKRHPSINRNIRRRQPLPLFFLTVQEVKTVSVASGEKFCPLFPLAGTYYVPVWFPVFRMDRCILKEEEEGSPVSDNISHFTMVHLWIQYQCMFSHLTRMIKKRLFFTWLSVNCTNVLLNQVKHIPPYLWGWWYVHTCHICSNASHQNSQQFLYWHKRGMDMPTANLLCTS